MLLGYASLSAQLTAILDAKEKAVIAPEPHDKDEL